LPACRSQRAVHGRVDVMDFTRPYYRFALRRVDRPPSWQPPVCDGRDDLGAGGTRRGRSSYRPPGTGAGSLYSRVRPGVWSVVCRGDTPTMYGAPTPHLDGSRTAPNGARYGHASRAGPPPLHPPAGRGVTAGTARHADRREYTRRSLPGLRPVAHGHREVSAAGRRRSAVMIGDPDIRSI
jgi:hypothetical protein